MVGNDRIRIRLQDRDRRLLEELGTMGVVDREQAKSVGRFTSTSAVNVRLLALTRAGILKRMFIGGNKAVYRLSAEAQRQSRQKRDRGLPQTTLFTEHQLAINDVYVLLAHGQRPDGVAVQNWTRFFEPLASSLPLIPDAYCTVSGANVPATFLEVDLGTEPQRVWQRKARLYVELATSGQFSTLFGESRFRVLVIARSERRIESIRTTISKITDRLFWFASFQNIHRESIWTPIWLRPVGATQLSLV